MIRDELLGRHVTVFQAANKSLLHIQGECVDETKYALYIVTKQGVKIVLKRNVVFTIDSFLVDGNILIGRPEKRTKQKVIRWQRRKSIQ